MAAGDLDRVRAAMRDLVEAAVGRVLEAPRPAMAAMLAHVTAETVIEGARPGAPGRDRGQLAD
jgi:hypothetical protein